MVNFRTEHPFCVLSNNIVFLSVMLSYNVNNDEWILCCRVVGSYMYASLVVITIM